MNTPDPITPRPDPVTEARDALATAIDAVGLHYRIEEARQSADRILAALPDGWTLARAEAGVSVSVEALLDAWETQEHPSIDAAIQTALAARPAGSGSRVERVPLPEGHRWCDACSGQGVFRIEMSPEPVSPTPPPAVGTMTDAEGAAFLSSIRPTPPPAVDGTRCHDFLPTSFCEHIDPNTPPAPDPDRLRALEAALERMVDATNRLMQAWAERPLKLLPGVMDEALNATAAARALLADGEPE